MEEGKIRLATPEDIKAWEDLAKSKERRIQKVVLDCGRTFTILKQLVIPRNVAIQKRFSGSIVYMVDKKAPFPKLERSGSPIYDLQTGGWYMLGEYDDGNSEGKGRHFPRYDATIYTNK